MNKASSWVFFVAGRYITQKRGARKNPSSILSFAGIATGVMAIIIVLSVIDGFQSGFIENILEISSYHLRALPPSEQEIDEQALLETMRAVHGVEAVIPFIELQTITKGQRRNQQGALVRGIPPDSLEKDPGLARQLAIEDGSFDLSQSDSIVLGAELALFLGVGVGDQISVMSMSGTALETLKPEDTRFFVRGIFRSGFYEYDLGWAFIPIETAEMLYGNDAPIVYGVKLEDRWKDARMSAVLQTVLGPQWSIDSWRSFNRAFFGALRTEKILMFILMGLIFIVVALNIFQGQRRTVMERYEEIGLLKAVGASGAAVRLIFTLDGFLIGFFGALAGLVPGLLIASNIQGFFGILETLVNTGIGLINAIIALFTGASPLDASFSIFSSAVFYVKEIPSRLIPFEVFLICLFGVGAATMAAWLASARSTGIKPAEVLRYE